MKKKKKPLDGKLNVQAIYMRRNGILNSANVGERGVISIKMVEGSALVLMDNGQEFKFSKEEIDGIAVKNKKSEISTFVKNKSGELIKIRNEETNG